MAAPADFARECGHVAKALRRIPREVRRELAAQARDQIAGPLARKVAAASRGPWSRVLTAGAKARAGADPTIVIGGARPRLSGGGGPRDVVFGSQWGGGRRPTTKQFVRNRTPYIYPTINGEMPAILDTYADVIITTMDQEVQ